MAVFLLLSGSLCAQTSSLTEYPLVLTVASAHASKGTSGTTTDVVGFLSEGSWKKPIHLSCNAALSSLGPDGRENTYPARYGYKARATSPDHVWVYARDPGKSSMREYKCVEQTPNWDITFRRISLKLSLRALIKCLAIRSRASLRGDETVQQSWPNLFGSCSGVHTSRSRTDSRCVLAGLES